MDSDSTSNMDSSLTTSRQVTVTKKFIDDTMLPSYRSTISPRSTTIITRTNLVPTSSKRVTRTTEYSIGSIPTLGLGSIYSSSEVTNVKSEREKEKKDLQNLNERLASYIEKVRFLEAQNRKLLQDLEELKSKWGNESIRIKDMYEVELKQARNLLDENEHAKAKLDVRVRSLEEEITELKDRLADLVKERMVDKETIQKQHSQLSELEPELNLLRRRIVMMEEQQGRDKKEIQRLQLELQKTKADLENETVAHINAENRRQTLEEEIEFMKNLHETEIRELSTLAYRDTTPENREYWKSELSQAIRDIQDEYDSRLDIIRNELNTQFNIKINEYKHGMDRQVVDVSHTKEENKTLRSNLTDWRNRLSDLENKNHLLESQLNGVMRDNGDRERDWDRERIEFQSEIDRLRRDLDSTSVEINVLADKKLSLELEIAAYRKLLEGEESRISTFESLRDYVMSDASNAASTDGSTIVTSTSGNRVLKGELSARTTYQRSAKGPISVAETAPDGKWIRIENTGRKEEQMDAWSIKRRCDGKQEVTYTFPKFTLGLGKNKSAKIWAKGSMPQGSTGDLEFDGQTWGVGSNVTTILYNERGEEKASHIQKTMYG